MARELAAARQFDDGRENFRRRRHQPAIGQAEPDDEFPDQRQARPAATAPAPAAPTRARRPEARQARPRFRLVASADSSTVMAIARTRLAGDCKVAAEPSPGGRGSSHLERSEWVTPGAGDRSRRRQHSVMQRRSPHPRTLIAFASTLLPQGERVRLYSIRRQRNLVVDQRVERGLDVDLGVDHAGLLQRQTPAARMDSRCGAPIRLWVSSVRSLSCLSTTASGSLVTAMKVFFRSS